MKSSQTDFNQKIKNPIFLRYRNGIWKNTSKFARRIIKSQFSVEEKHAKPIFPKNNQWFAEEQETNSEKLKKLKEWEF